MTYEMILQQIKKDNKQDEINKLPKNLQKLIKNKIKSDDTEYKKYLKNEYSKYYC